MSLHSQPIGVVPEDTIRVARAAFPRGHLWLILRDELGSIFTNESFATLFSQRGQPAIPPWRLAVVTLLQYAEGLSDCQAADAVRGRIDWKYLLGLELTDPGFDYSVLCEFRARACSRVGRRRSCSTCSWSSARPAVCCGSEAGNAPTPRTCSPVFVR
jgi:transposase